MANFKIFHNEPPPPEVKGLILLPIGEYYNRDLMKIQPGDTITFLGGYKYTFISKCILRTDESFTDFICRYIYQAPINVVIRKWRRNAVFEGYGGVAVDDEKCLCIWYKEKSVQ